MNGHTPRPGPAAGVAAAVRSGERTATRVVEEALARIRAGDGQIHAFNLVVEEQARAAAADVDAAVARGEDPGPLAGVPVALKDNLCTRGVATTCSSRILAGWAPPYDATVVERLRSAGAIMVGKANMDEFAMGSSTENSATGPTRNPRDQGRVPGGSSGGSAAAVAADFVPLALGSDTGGSIRQPAALCGVVGFKPTYGAVSRYGLIAFASSLDQIGPLAHTVADAALLFDVIGGHDPRDSTSLDRPAPRTSSVVDDGVAGLTVGVVDELVDAAAPDVAARTREAAEALTRAGATVTEVSLPELRLGLSAYYLIAPGEASSNLARYDGVRYGLRIGANDTPTMYTATRTAGFGDEVKRRIMLGTYVLSAGYMDAYYLQALRARTRIIEAFASAYHACDVLLGPTAPTTAFPLGEHVDDPMTMYLNDVCTIPSNLAGHPAVSVPFGTGTDGLPIGVQVMGPGLADSTVLRVAAALEQMAPIPADSTTGGTAVSDAWEMVIGLEVHCELNTVTKLFCGCPNAFGSEPNTNVCPVCLGLPGSLPVLNQRAVELAMAIGTALHCEVRPSTFHRKNYFYPDQAKDYQISQYDEPINADGWLELPDGFRVGVERAHLEEDTGKTSHAGTSGRIHGADYSLVDYNRSGVPLVEIVSAPDLRSAAQARAYVTELRAILVASGASDGKMEEGSMRVDANVSVRRGPDAPFGTRCEIKNLNSVRSLGRAIEYEAERQIGVIEDGSSVAQETRHWDEDAGRTHTLRSKEEAYDYRYFLEPDLVPLVPDAEWVAEVADGLGPLPAERRTRLIELVGDGGDLSGAQADQVATVVDLGLDDLVVASAHAGVTPALALTRTANEAATDPDVARATDPGAYAALLGMEQGGSLSATQVKTVLGDLLAAGGGDPAALAAARGFEAMSDDSLVGVVDDVIAAHPDEWARDPEGGEKADKLTGFFTGQVMKATRGQANGKAVAAELARRQAIRTAGSAVG